MGSKIKAMEMDKKSNPNLNIFIKKVILENFLSFSRDEVDFLRYDGLRPARFIVIVGPNWSGKTSIFQAIKFALGSNERGERYPKWSDFIRHGQDHTMVELHIQNGKKSFQVRRTVIRGKSPYFSLKKSGENNFKRVNASEIQTLIQDLNFNPDNNFAFVSQGKVDAIKSLKPTELSNFLEEGIGLSGLRKEILDQKSNVSSLNKELHSLITKKNTLNLNLELLQPKLKKLEEKKKLLKKRKTYEDELLWANRQKLLLEIVNLVEKIREYKNLIKDVQKTKGKFDLKINKFKEDLEDLEEKINQLSGSLGEKKYQKKELIQKIQNWQSEKVKMKQDIEQISNRIKEIEKIILNFKTQKESLLNEQKIIKESLEQLQKRFDELLKEQSRLTEKIEENQQFLDHYNKLTSEKENLEGFISKNHEIINEINNQITQLFQSFDEINHKLEKNKWFLENPTNNLIKELDNKLHKTQNKLYDIEHKLKNLEFQKSKIFEDLKQLQGSLKERRVMLPSQIKILKDEIRKRELDAIGPLIDYIKYDDKLSYAIESVMGEKLLYSFVASDWDTMELLKRLKSKFNAYCNIYVPKKENIEPFFKINADGVIGYLAELIKTNNIDIKKVIYSKVKNCLVVDNYQSGRRLYSNHNFKGKCVTLKGEQIISYKYVYETPFHKKLKGLLSTGTQKEQVKNIEETIERINSQISELKVKASKLDSIQKDIYEKKQSFDDLLYNFNQKQRLTTKKNQLYKKRTQLQEQSSNSKEKIKNLNNNIKDLEKQKDSKFFTWSARLKEIPSELKDINEQKKKWEEKLKENNEIFTEANNKLKYHEKECESLKGVKKVKTKEFKKADKDAFEIYRDLEETEIEISEINTVINKLREEKQSLIVQKESVEKQKIETVLNLEQKQGKLKNYVQEANIKNENLNRINSEIGPKIKRKEIEPRKIEEIEADIQNINKKLLQYYDVDESLLVERDQLIGSLKKITKNQNQLKNDINEAFKTEEKMENVYYDKFKSVLNSIEENINRKFKSSNIKVYCALELIGNFEELGVDIKASNSDQKLISCSALSGGQISMISIALILSLQETEPSPLCMFDEAGMFLDDKNSEIAYQLIKSTLEENPIQMVLFLPKSSSFLYQLAEKIIGVARAGKNEVSTIFKPKIIEKED
ncbi:MAG: chromosome segregation SMC family protein [Candidatus Lokiarchaeota archaeon]